MPLYEYICNNTDCEIKTFEVLSSYSDEDVEMCPGCGDGTKQRKMFYQFDFRM